MESTFSSNNSKTSNSDFPEVMTRQQCAKYLKICLVNLDKSDCPRIKLSTHAVRYRKSSVDQWLRSLETTNEEKAE